MTHNHAIQVSDRRLVDLSTGTPVPVEDDQNKAVLFGSIMTFGYTGLAKIENKKTDIWLTEVLSDPAHRSLKDAIEAVRDRATCYFRSIRRPRGWQQSRFQIAKRHAFVGAGWIKQSAGATLSPTVILISNYQAGNKHGHLLAEANNEFEIWLSPELKKSDKCFFLLTGQQPVSAEDKMYVRELNRNLKRCASKDVSPKTILSLLSVIIRRFAARYKTVGNNLMAVSLPKATAERGNLSLGEKQATLIVSSLPVNGAPTFLYIPAEQNKGIEYGPNVAFPGGNRLTDYRITKVSQQIHSSPINPLREAVSAGFIIVLSEWTGTGTWFDKRRAVITDHYQLSGFVDVTGAPSWPREEPCPHYGNVVAVKGEPEIINKLEKDPNYVVIMSSTYVPQELPDDPWIDKLKRWLIDHGMSTVEIETFIKELRALNRLQIAKKLIAIMKGPAISQH